MTLIDPAEQRKPLWFANYAGDVTESFTSHRLKGPNGFGETLVAITIHVKGDGGITPKMTRVGLALATEPDITDQLERTPFQSLPAAFGGGQRAMA